MRRRLAVGAAVAVVVIVAAIAVLHDAAAGVALRALAVGLGYRVQFAQLHAGLTAATVSGLHVTRGGEPLLDADRVEVHYRLRDLLPGGRHLYGLTALDVTRPQVTLIHNADGSYNIALPTTRATTKPGSPLALTARVRGGTVALVDRFTAPGKTSVERIEDIDADANIAPATRSSYRAAAIVAAGTARDPVQARGVIDPARGFADQRVDAPRLPLAGFARFAMPNHAVALTAGRLRGLHVRMYAIIDPKGGWHSELSGGATFEDGTLYAAGLTLPITGVHGPFAIFDGGVLTSGIDARVAGVPLHLAGGVFGGSPLQLRVVMSGRGPLERLREIAQAAARQPLSGDLTFAMRAQGPLSQPVVTAWFSAPALTYRSYRLTAPSGAIAFTGRRLEIVDARATYGGVRLAAAGQLQLERRIGTDLAVTVAGDVSRLPYVGAVLRAPLNANGAVTLRGTGSALASHAAVFGAGPAGTLDAVASLAANGSGTVGPIAFAPRAGGSLYARFDVDRPHDALAGIVDLQHLALRPAFAAAASAQLAVDVEARHLAGLAGALRVDGSYGTFAATAKAAGDEVALLGHVRPANSRGPGASVAVRGRIGATSDLLVTAADLDPRLLARFGVPVSGGNAVAVGRVLGSLQSPEARLGLAVDNARVDGVPVAAQLFARYRDRRVTLVDATVLAADGALELRGTVDASRGAPQLALRGAISGVQLAQLAPALQVPLKYPDGELDADLSASGSAAAPQLAADVRIDRGSVDLLDFTGAHVTLHGSRSGIALSDGRVTVGSTDIAFSGALASGVRRVAVRAPRLDLADFNSAFLAPDTLAGRGSLALDADLSGAGVRTTGNIALADTRIRRFALGDLAAAWSTAGRTVSAEAGVRGTHGSGTLAGTVTVPPGGSLTRSTAALHANVTALDLGSWLPAAGIFAPVLGTVDGTASLNGSLAAPQLNAAATLHDGFVGRYPIQVLTAQAAADRQGARLERLHVVAPGVQADASGSAGYGARDALALQLHAQSPDVGLLARQLGIRYPVGGSATVDARVSGTRNRPQLLQTLDLRNLQADKLLVPHVHAELAADPTAVELRSGEADLTAGRALLSLRVPLARRGSGFTLGTGPIAAGLRAERIDLAQFAPALPASSELAGTLDGDVHVGGTLAAPSLGGALALSGGRYASSVVTTPFTDIGARLAFAGTRAQLSALHAAVGGGTVDGSGDASVGNLRDPLHALALNLQLTARQAGIALSRLFSGKIDGTIRLAQQRGGTPVLGGEVALSQTNVPISALLAATAKKSGAPPPPLAFDLGITLGSDVGVQSSNINVRGTGHLDLQGTLARPLIAGSLHAVPGGTITFYRMFTVQQAAIQFDPSSGIIPNIEATATTTIPSPPANVVLHVQGPATHLALDLSSQPPYDREQIVGLLVGAQAFGAVAGLPDSGEENAPTLQSLAGNYIVGTFTAKLLAPISNAVMDALGLENLTLNYSETTGFSANAYQRLTKNLSASVGQSFGPEQRQSLGLIDHLSPTASVQFTLFNAGQLSPVGWSSPLAPAGPTNFALQALAPPPGSSGYILTYQRRFW